VDQVEHRCVKTIDCVVDPDIGMIAESHHPGTDAPTLGFDEDWQFIAKPACFFDAFAAMMSAGKAVPGMSTETVQNNDTTPRLAQLSM